MNTNLGSGRAPGATEDRLVHGVADVHSSTPDVVASVEVCQQGVQVERSEREVDGAVVELVREWQDLRAERGST